MGGGKAPAPPPPPPPPPAAPATLASPGLQMTAGQVAMQAAAAAGAGFDNTLKTTAQGVAAPQTTQPKLNSQPSLLGQ